MPFACNDAVVLCFFLHVFPFFFFFLFFSTCFVLNEQSLHGSDNDFVFL